MPADPKPLRWATQSMVWSVVSSIRRAGTLLLLAVVIALLGITHALALAIVERTREVGMLRAVGMTRRQVSRMVRTEAALTATVGAVTGIALGLVVDPVHRPRPLLGVHLAVAVLGGVLAGLLPGRRASRMDVLAAIATRWRSTTGCSTRRGRAAGHADRPVGRWCALAVTRRPLWTVGHDH